MARKNRSHSSKLHPSLERKPGGPDNWVEKAGGLPSYIERIAKHIHHDSGLSISHAIASAVNRVKVLCAKGNAQACAAVASWEKKKAGTRVKTTEVKGRKLTDFEFAELVADIGYNKIELINRAPGASGSNQSFDESKYLRNPGNGKFSAKFTPTEMIAGRRIVEGGITNLQIGQIFELPGDSGWVKRSEAGYLIQGPAGVRIVVPTLAEAVQASASIIAGKIREVGDPVK